MADAPENDLRAWLEAEETGDAAAADAIFASVFAHYVPPLAPAEPIAARVGALLRPTRVLRLPQPALRLLGSAWAAAVLIVLGGMAAALFSSTWVFDLVRLVRTAGPRVLAAGLAAAGLALEFLWNAWLAIDAIARALAVVASSGPATAIIAANLTIALVAALALARLLSPEEE
jgi:hypothetical protein